MIRVDVKLNASLKIYGRDHSSGGLFSLEVGEEATVLEVIYRLDIPLEKVKMILLNGKRADLGNILSEGDRIALFPPEVAFNMYVAFSFRRDLTKKTFE